MPHIPKAVHSELDIPGLNGEDYSDIARPLSGGIYNGEHTDSGFPTRVRHLSSSSASPQNDSLLGDSRSRQSGSPARSSSGYDSMASSQQQTPSQRYQQQQQLPPGARKDIKRSINTAFSSFSKGIGSLNKNLTDKMKGRKDYLDPDDLGASDDLETMSIKSGSSDDLDYLLKRFTNEPEAPAFESKGMNLGEESSLADNEGGEYGERETSSLHTLGSCVERSQGVVRVNKYTQILVILITNAFRNVF